MENNMKYSIDRIEQDKVVLENLKNKEIKIIEIEKFPEYIKEGNIVLERNNQYKILEKEEIQRRQKLRKKLKKIKKK